MGKYEDSFKLEVAQRCLCGLEGTRTVARRYGLDRGTVRNWVERYRYHGLAGLSKKASRYSAAFKLSVLRRMWRDELSHRQVAALFDLRAGHVVVSTWERQYHAGGPEALKRQPRGRPKTMPAPKPPQAVAPHADDAQMLKALREENEYLRAEVAYLKKLDALVRANRQAAQNKRKRSSN